MAHNEGAINLIKQDASNKLNFYNKVIPNLPHSLNDLLEKAKSVENKLDTNKNGTNALGAEGSELNKSPNLNENQKRDTRFFEFDNFRRVNNYIPKIHINKHKERDKDKIILPFASPKDESYKGIMSLYNDKTEFRPISNKYNPITIQEHNELAIKKSGEENAIQRNDINYDYSLEPYFYTNRYIEYLYEDQGDKLYEENNVLKNLFDKNPNRDSKNELNFINSNSPYLKAYNDLLEKEKEEVENENKEMYQNEMLRGQEFTLSKTEHNNILNFIKNNKAIFNEKSPLDTFFELNSLKRKSNINQNENENSPRGENEHEENKDKDREKDKEKKTYEPDDISFEIDVQGEITKKIRNSSKKQHPRGMVLHGPIAEWYRLNEEHDITKKKGDFDIRKIDFDSKEKSNNEDGEEEFTVKDVRENNKLNKKDTIFTSRKIVEFGNKTFKYFFQQLQKYFVELLNNINKASYSILKFLSDTQCTSLELSLEHQKDLIEYIYWHPNLQILAIPSSFVSKLNEVMSKSDWECKLHTLTIKKSVNSSNSSDNPESDLKNIFSNPASLTIQNIHFIDVSYSKKLLEALFIHIDTFYEDYDNIKNSICNIKPEEFKEIKVNKIPIINLSWKKTPNLDGSSKSEDTVNLKGIYYLLMYMLIKALKYNNGTLPEVFNKLDLSESTVSDDISYLVKIITKFKIIKELDISNTKFLSAKKVIDSTDFLSNIKLTKNYTEIFDQKKFYDSSLDKILDDITIFREPENKDKNLINTNINIDEDNSYDYSMGILPILEKIYIHNTDAKEDVSKDIYYLFKKLKFFRGIYYSDQTSKMNQENNNQNIICEGIVDKINIDKKTYCENVFQLSNE